MTTVKLILSFPMVKKDKWKANTKLNWANDVHTMSDRFKWITI